MARKKKRLGIILALLLIPIIGSVYALKSRKKHRRTSAAALSAAVIAPPSMPAPEPKVYEEKIQPLLKANCVSCHGVKRQEGGLRLDSLAGLLKGGHSGPAVSPGQAERSLLWQRVTDADAEKAMPASGARLETAQIDALKRWIDDGAMGPLDEKVAPRSVDHWAFHTPQKPPMPEAVGSGNPIDAFVNQALRNKELRATPPMDRGRLLRRASIDLTGLPPTLDEFNQFVDDPATDAYERAVDRLLASPRYGERWARHWMDVWRYADEDGRRDDKGEFTQIHWSSPHLWHWRDWIIDSLNADKGYDRMILEMLAGDELEPANPRVVAATGFLARSRCQLDRNVWLATTVEHTSKAFLGLSLNCARCHAHKFDPIPQEDYYRFRAFFEPHEIVDEKLVFESGKEPSMVALARDTKPGAETFLFERGNEARPVKSLKIEPGTPWIVSSPFPSLMPALDSAHAAKTPGSLAITATNAGTGRRLALARWMTAPQNPLTARVAVNHIWLRHFGRGLVETPSEFGLRGKAPSHPELLDWLAVAFQRHGWSMKWLHRVIVTSDAYCRHSAAGDEFAASAAADPENIQLWKGPTRRLESEALRDALLHLAGKLDTRIGGPNQLHTDGETSARRSLYFRTSREDKVPFLAEFNPPNLDECYLRDTSVVPQQALALANSDLAWNCAAAIAEELPTDTDRFIADAYARVLCRRPSAAEEAACREFLRDQEALLANEEDQSAAHARSYLVHALLNHNDFITVR